MQELAGDHDAEGSRGDKRFRLLRMPLAREHYHPEGHPSHRKFNIRSLPVSAGSFASGRTSLHWGERVLHMLEFGMHLDPGERRSLGRFIFVGCERLKEIYFGGTVEAWKRVRFRVQLGVKKVPVICADGVVKLL